MNEIEPIREQETPISPDADFYEILGVAINASKEEIHLAFKRLAQKHHPDKPNGRSPALLPREESL